uniref:Zn-dependent hydrolase n=1 Tax=Acidicaldus sp. TaxID=1872105 RepID=A0A8J4HCW8_9PROT
MDDSPLDHPAPHAGAAPYHAGRFHNPGAPPPRKRGLGFLRWRLSARGAAWPRQVPNSSFPPPPADIAPDEVAASFIGHATFFLNLAGLRVLTDPIFSERCSPVSWAGPKRVRPPGLRLADLPPIDLVLISHCHYDHMDLPSLRALAARDRPRFVTPLGNARHLARAGIKEAVELDWWQSFEGTDWAVTATPARHFSARSPFDFNRALWAGFMLRRGPGQVFFAGDSGAGPHWAEIRARLGAPDLALLPIGAYEPRWFMAPVHMDPAEAVAAHLALGARHSVGMHFGTFKLTDEAIDAPPQALAAARRAAGLAPASFIVQGFGETRVFPLRA